MFRRHCRHEAARRTAFWLVSARCLKPVVKAGIATVKADSAVMTAQAAAGRLQIISAARLGAVMVRFVDESDGVAERRAGEDRNKSNCSGEMACQACCTSSSRRIAGPACKERSRFGLRARSTDRAIDQRLIRSGVTPQVPKLSRGVAATDQQQAFKQPSPSR